METDDTLAQVQALDQAHLTGLVRRVPGRATLEISTWHAAPINVAMPNFSTGGLYRVAGTGRDQGELQAWSLVLKVVCSPGANVVGSDDPPHHRYWQREPLAYQSGVLQDLPAGLDSPRCFGVVPLPGKVTWIWLEDLTDHFAHRWPLARYGLAARHLGRFNGAYVAGKPLPVYSWLCAGLLRSLVPELAAREALLHDPRTWQHPLLRRTFPVSITERLRRLLPGRETFLTALERLPQTLCHFDANYSNLFACVEADGEDRTVAIDWAFLGVGAVGEELSMLVWPAVLAFKVELAEARQLEEIALAGYLEGLRDAGWRGDPRLVWFGYVVNAALQWGVVPPAVAFAHDPQPGWLERGFGRSLEEIVERSAAVTWLLLDRLDGVKQLVDVR